MFPVDLFCLAQQAVDPVPVKILDGNYVLRPQSLPAELYEYIFFLA